MKDKKVWDEERQEWVDRWGRGGKNKEKEEQWIQVLPDQARMYLAQSPPSSRFPVPLGLDCVASWSANTFLLLADDYNPAAEAKSERKQRVSKNEGQRMANLARAERAERKTEVEKTLLRTKGSTASMGK